MKKLLITVGAITTATRFARLIESKAGKHAAVIQTPSALNTGGCSYSIRISDADLAAAQAVSAKYKVPIRKVYKINGGEYNALSG